MAGGDRPAEKQQGVLRALNAIDRVIAAFEVIVLAYGVLLMAANSIANVFGRFVISHSIYFSEELNQFLIVLITFVGLSYAARKGRHIRMSALYDQLSDRHKKILMIFISAVTAGVMFVLAFYAYKYVSRVARLGKVTPALQVPLYLTYVWVPVGFAITGIQYLLTIVSNLRHADVYISFEQIDMYDETGLEGAAQGTDAAAPEPAAAEIGPRATPDDGGGQL